MTRPPIAAMICIAITLCAATAAPPRIVTADFVVLAIPVNEVTGLTHSSALEKLASGQAKLVTQSSLATRVGQRAKVEFHRGHKFSETMKRRGESAALPDGCAIWRVGTALEIDPQARAGGKIVDLTLEISTHVAEPKPSPLTDRLAAMKMVDGIEQEVPRPQFAEIRSSQKIEDIAGGKTAIVYVAPPEGIAPGEIYAVLIRARSH